MTILHHINYLMHGVALSSRKKDNISSRHESYSVPHSGNISIILEMEINLSYKTYDIL